MAFLMHFALTSDESKKLRDAFKSMDKDNSGTLSLEEVTDGLKKVCGNATAAEIQEVAEKLDADGNGTIDYSEFLVGSINKQKLLSKENLGRAFKLLDKVPASLKCLHFSRRTVAEASQCRS